MLLTQIRYFGGVQCTCTLTGCISTTGTNTHVISFVLLLCSLMLNLILLDQNI